MMHRGTNRDYCVGLECAHRACTARDRQRWGRAAVKAAVLSPAPGPEPLLRSFERRPARIALGEMTKVRALARISGSVNAQLYHRLRWMPQFRGVPVVPHCHSHPSFLSEPNQDARPVCRQWKEQICAIHLIPTLRVARVGTDINGAHRVIPTTCSSVTLAMLAGKSKLISSMWLTVLCLLLRV